VGGLFTPVSGGHFERFFQFTSENKWSGDFVRNFDPEAITGKFEVVIENPTTMTLIFFNTDGVKTGESKWSKIK
jgi:hypothetical protein